MLLDSLYPPHRRMFCSSFGRSPAAAFAKRRPAGGRFGRSSKQQWDSTEAMVLGIHPQPHTPRWAARSG